MLPTCTSCMDAGFITLDGDRIPCSNCQRGREWSDARSETGRRVQTGLPPGGDVLRAQAAREAAGLPAGALPVVGARTGAPIRAVLASERDALDAALSDVREARDLLRNLAGIAGRLREMSHALIEPEEAAALSDLYEALDALPAWAVPQPERPPLAAVRAAPMTPGG